MRYIDLVNAFKKAARAGETTSPEFSRRVEELGSFYSEGRGHRRRKSVRGVDYVSRHGEVVDALRDWRVRKPSARGETPTKTVLFDFGMKVGSDLVELYEVKSSASRFDVYCAIGQLMVHGIYKDCASPDFSPIESASGL